MSSTSNETANPSSDNAVSTWQRHKYKGIRRRKWGKWVSEIRVPGTSDRLWLGSYATPQAAAVSHDVALYCLRGDSSLQKLNFPLLLPSTARIGLSPQSVQKAASDAGMAMDAQLLDSNRPQVSEADHEREFNYLVEVEEEENLSISVEDYL